MSIIISVISMLGGLAMFLYGMEIMSDGLKSASGPALKRILERVTSNLLIGAIMGMLVTAVIQSSTATIVITVGLLTAGVINLRQAISISFGANIGTTITAQMVRLMDLESESGSLLDLLKPSTLAPLAMLIAIILILFIRRKNCSTIGNVFAGFGILFTGIIGMSSALTPLTSAPFFAGLMEKFSQNPLLGILAGFVTTVIAQSSSATVTMLQSLSATGMMTFDVVYPIIMGINIGTCVTTAIVCSIGSSKDAKRAGVADIAFNVIGTVLFMALLETARACGLFPALWGRFADSGLIADFQTVFNLLSVILFLPFTGLFVKLTYLVVKPGAEDEKKEEYPELNTLSERLYLLPNLAIAEAASAIGAMGDIAHENFRQSILQLQDFDSALSAEILSRENTIDRFTDTVENFLVKLSQSTLSDEESEKINLLIQASANFERIGDYATNINEFAEKLNRENSGFSADAIAQMSLLTAAVDELIGMTISAFDDPSGNAARQIEPLEEVIDDMVLYLNENHVNRLKAGKCSITVGLFFAETLTYLERAADQCSSTAMLLLALHDPEIRQNHHAYVSHLHEGEDQNYTAELVRRQEQYLVPLRKI